MHIFLAYMIAVVVVIAVAMVVLNLQKPSVDVEIENVKQGDTIWWYHSGELHNAVVITTDIDGNCCVRVHYFNYSRLVQDIIPLRNVIKVKRKI